MANHDPPQDRPAPRPFQFGFWTLAEVVAGVAIAMAVIVELRELAHLVLLPALALLLAGWSIGWAKNRRSALLFAVSLGWVAGLFCLAPTVSTPLEAIRRNMCSNNLKYITLALHAYHDDYHVLPPAVVYDSQGKPMHSWRALILPFLGTAPAGVYDYSQPWNSPASAVMMPSVYRCPSCNAPANTTSYFYVVGPGRERIERGVALDELVHQMDGTPDTILVVESNTLLADWREPRDLSMKEALRPVNLPSKPCISSLHGTRTLEHVYRGVNVATADAAVHFISDDLDQEMLKAVLTENGGEIIDWSKLRGIPDRRWVVAWLICCTIFYIAFILWRHWPRTKAQPIE
ncbi:MAG: DUF1559 domain-containing protein [Pirellulales bacterium]